MPRSLTQKQRAFIANVQTGLSDVQAAIKAGYSEHSAKWVANDLRNHSPLVKAELQRVQSELAETAKLNGETALAFADEMLAFAKSSKNPNAFVKAGEIKLKLCGFLEQKVKMDVTVTEKIDVACAIAEARARVGRQFEDLPTLEGDFKRIDSPANG